MMKKIISLLLIVGMLISLVACEESIDAKALYAEALSNMSALSSVRMDTDMNISVEGSADDASVSIPMQLSFIGTGMGTDAESYYMETSASFLGASTNLKQWVVDGVVYTDQDGVKYTSEDTSTALTSDGVMSLAIEGLSDVSAAKNEDGSYLITINVTEEEIDTVMSDIIGTDVLSEMLGDVVIVAPVTLHVTITSERMISALDMTMTIEVAEVGAMSYDASFTYSEYDTATLPEYDPAEFETLNITDGEIYGDHDITKDQAALLEASGYENLTGDIYYNGTYYIDLDLKQFYAPSTSYAWEYDQAFSVDDELNFTCQYDMISGVAEGECDTELLDGLKSTYNDLATSLTAE